MSEKLKNDIKYLLVNCLECEYMEKYSDRNFVCWFKNS